MLMHARRVDKSTLMLVAAVSLAVCAVSGCEKTLKPAEKPDPAGGQEELAEFQPLEGTVAAATYLEGVRLMLVQGYGLVVGLPGTGSRECPETLRRQLTQEIAKRQYAVRWEGSERIVSPAVLLDSNETAVVRVWGYMPAGAVEGERFDVFVEALPNTQTTSLEGGRLFTTDLRISDPVAAGASKPLAQACGPVFINPFAQGGSADQRSAGIAGREGMPRLKRRGYILGGGETLQPRHLRLVLYQPSYGMARTIRDRINSRFPPPGDQLDWQTAVAGSAGVIELNIPQQYRDQRPHFLALVRNLFIRNDPSYLQIKARELSELILKPKVNAQAISMAWEGMGQTVLPAIQPLYASSSRQAAFYAARAGARLGDPLAAEVLGRFANEPEGPFRDQAIITLGYSRSVTGEKILRDLLASKNVRVRTLAYEALERHRSRLIERFRVGSDNFLLDALAGGLPMIYATRSVEPKIVLFGEPLKLTPPLFYVHADQSVTLRADAGQDHVVLVRRTAKGRTSDPIRGPLLVKDLIILLGNDPQVDQQGNVAGLGLSYSHVVAILKYFCDSGALNARFVLQQPELTFSGGAVEAGRPEKDSP